MLTDNRALPWLVDLSDYNVQKKSCSHFHLVVFTNYLLLLLKGTAYIREQQLILWMVRLISAVTAVILRQAVWAALS